MPGTPQILMEDGPLLAVNKPSGLLTLGAKPGVPTLERQVKEYLKDRYHKPGNVYLGIPHRLDRPVSGVVVFARNSKAAARLAEQFRERQVEKTYRAIIEGRLDAAAGEMIDWIAKVADRALVQPVPAQTEGAREARLAYRTLSVEQCAGGGCQSLVEISLLTGRMHQIRAQFAARGAPILGDIQYGATRPLDAARAADPREEPIALHAWRIALWHPIRYDRVCITAPVPACWPQQEIAGAHSSMQ
jgi:23S rRNA pseudouridine1911/1915/1917 synthase